MDAIEDENNSDKDSEVNTGVYIKASGKDTGRGIHKIEIATISLLSFIRIESNRDVIDFRTILW